jgi:peptidylprolyl isomerase
MKKLLSTFLPLIVLALLSGCQTNETKPPVTTATTTPTATPAISPTPPGSPVASPGDSALKTTPSGLKYQDLVVGMGSRPLFGATARLHYTGWTVDGIKFDSSQGKPPLEVVLGRGEVIKGWELGVGGGRGLEPMQVGGKRKLVIPPELGYGANPMGTIPPNSTLVFEIELIGVK